MEEKKISDYCTGLNHMGVPTLDIDKSINFYTSIGFKIAQRLCNNGQNVCFLKNGNLIIETYDREGAAMEDGAINHIAIDVHDIDNLFEIVKKKGFKLLTYEVNPLPYWEHGIKYFVVEGPNKERIEFCERLKK